MLLHVFIENLAEKGDSENALIFQGDPTDPSKISDPQNSSTDVSKQRDVCPFSDFETLKLGKGRSGWLSRWEISFRNANQVSETRGLPEVLPDSLLHNFMAPKSADRPTLCGLEASIHGLRGFKNVKGSVRRLVSEAESFFPLKRKTC